MNLRSARAAALVNLALCLLCLLGLAASAYFLSGEQKETDYQVRRVQEVVSRLSRMQHLALDAESTGRAYVLIREEALHRRFETLLADLRRDTEALREKLAEDPEDNVRVSTLHDALQARFAFLSRVVEVRAAGDGLDAAVALAKQGTGRNEMANATALMAELQARKSGELDAYLARRDAVRQQHAILTLGFILAGIALALWIYWQTRTAAETRESSDRQKEHMLHHDALTGLPNRRYLQERLRDQIAEASRRSSPVVVMYLDLDGFKAVNDTFGHDAGDELLADVARRLRGALRSDDVVARLGGDEFVASLAHLHSPVDVELVAQKLVNVLGGPYTLDACEAHVSASIGVAMYPRDGHTPEALLVAADRALYAAKSAGKHCFRWAAAGEVQAA